MHATTCWIKVIPLIIIFKPFCLHVTTYRIEVIPIVATLQPILLHTSTCWIKVVPIVATLQPTSCHFPILIKIIPIITALEPTCYFFPLLIIAPIIISINPASFITLTYKFYTSFHSSAHSQSLRRFINILSTYIWHLQCLASVSIAISATTFHTILCSSTGYISFTSTTLVVTCFGIWHNTFCIHTAIFIFCTLIL